MLPSAVKRSLNLAFLFDLTELPILKCLTTLSSVQTESIVQTGRHYLDVSVSGAVLSPAGWSRSRQCKKNGILGATFNPVNAKTGTNPEPPKYRGVKFSKGNQEKLSHV